MDEVDGDLGNAGMFHPQNKPGYEPMDRKGMESFGSFTDSGLGSISSMGSQCLSGAEGMMARMNLAQKIHDRNLGGTSIDGGYHSTSIKNEEEIIKKEPVAEEEHVAEDEIKPSESDALYVQDKDGDT